MKDKGNSNHWVKKLTVLCAVIASITIGVIFISHSGDQKFNSNDWKKWKETEVNLNLRWEMIHHLTHKHKLVGMNRSEVIDLLGDPSSESINSLSYYLGMTGTGINTGSLKLIFNDDNKVKQFKVTQG